MSQSERIFLVTFLAPVLSALAWGAYVLIWVDWLQPKARRAIDAAWDRFYLAYWRRQGVIAPRAPRRGQE